MMRRNRISGAVLAVGVLVAVAVAGPAGPAGAYTGEWHGTEEVSPYGLGLEVSWKDTRRGVSVEGIWIHPSGVASATYTITGYDAGGNILYTNQVTGAAGDDCIGTPYEEVSNPNVYGSIVSNGTVLVQVETFGYHRQYGYLSDSVTVAAVRGGA